MTNRRPSLLQARSGPHAHAHSAYKLGHAHGHGQHLHHQYPHDAVAGPRPDDVKPDNAQEPDLHNRAAVSVPDHGPSDVITPSATSLVTRVIQTVSLVQVVDTLGSPIETLTRFAVPNTVVIDKDSGKTISASNPDHTAAPPAPGSSPGPSGGISSSTSSTDSQSEATSSTDSQSKATSSTDSQSKATSSTDSQSKATSSTDSQSGTTPGTDSQSGAASIASSISVPSPSSVSLSPPAHSSPPTAPPAPSVGIGHNGTSIHHSINHNATNSLFHAESVNTTASSTKFSSTTTRHHTSSTTSEISSSQFTSYSEAVVSAISSFEPAPTDGAFGGVYGGDGAPTASSAAPTPSTSSNSTENALSPQQKQVIGGVVGGLAGAAFFLVLLLLALRYKRRQLSASQSASQSTSESRELPPTTGPSNGAPGGGAMTERYGAAALTAAFAGLAPKRSSASANSTETGERGFYRVSGRKLPSVLQVGGDGYSDPRSSFMSSTSDWNRGSQAFDPFGGPGARLQLGVPMRPNSGVPIVRSGPARPVVAESNPFADPPKTPPADASVPPMMRQRESPGRGSRFQEGL